MSHWKKFFTNTRIVILIAFIVLAVFAIHPKLDDSGVAIRGVIKDSAAATATPEGIASPKAGSTPTSREVLYSINNKEINSPEEYYDFTQGLEPGKTLLLKTNKNTYKVVTQAIEQVIVLNETEFVEVNKTVFDNETNTTKNVTEIVEQNKTITNILGTEDIGLSVYPVPTNNIRKGLDLEGGTRVLLSPKEEVSSEDLDLIMENIRQRLNVYGVSDIIVRSTQDFTGETYIVVEIAGASKEEVAELLANQGKFEAKVGENVVFKGGDDIKYVCRNAQCSGIDPQRGCSQTTDGQHVCAFRFSITISTEAAHRQADATSNLEVLYPDGVGTEGYLSENISLFLDDELVDTLRIGADLKGNAITDISISGSGTGPSQQAAATNALANMKKLQTVMVTGSLPVELEIIQTDAISPVLGEEFVKNAVLVGLLAIAAVALVVSIRYRRVKIAIPTIIAMLSEVVILLGFASLIGWRLDLAAIAGIIIAVGTGVDDQIVIIDETLSRKGKDISMSTSWKKRLARAFFIIMTAYFTTVVAMLPLWWSGAGLLKGFALTTIVGVSIGVFVTRPAFAKMLEIFLEKRKDDEQ